VVRGQLLGEDRVSEGYETCWRSARVSPPLLDLSEDRSRQGCVDWLPFDQILPCAALLHSAGWQIAYKGAPGKKVKRAVGKDKNTLAAFNEIGHGIDQLLI